MAGSRAEQRATRPQAALLQSGTRAKPEAEAEPESCWRSTRRRSSNRRNSVRLLSRPSHALRPSHARSSRIDGRIVPVSRAFATMSMQLDPQAAVSFTYLVPYRRYSFDTTAVEVHWRTY